jgi:predicted metal-dependent phosphoesterase TrpH
MASQILRVEFHCHTCYSDDGLITPQMLLEICREKHIDRLAVTDHNSISGALEAQQLDPQRFIVGEEVRTTAGEFLAFFVQEVVPRGLSPRAAIERLRSQGAFISVSHPMDRMRGWQLPDLLAVLPYIDALETFNSRCMWPWWNRDALQFARQHDLPGTSGSDAHIPEEVGRSTMSIEDFKDAAGLRQVIRRAVPHNRLSGWGVHFASSKAKEMKRGKLANKP